ncbi:hypothetical protein LCGC14_1090690 [marine sediment metagenome]|uniref:Uncharacterized protein n=1 Tax=marine sediment metagenome TaxID=412755 RepID=A0A0F9MGY9_9ZZZZ
MTQWKCGGCGYVYGFDEWLALHKIKAVPDDPDPKKNYGYTMVCKHCGYAFHHDKPTWKTYGEINHRITIFNRPIPISIELSTVFLELGHDDYDFGSGKREPNWYESMFFCHREGEREYKSAVIPDNYDELSKEEQMTALMPGYTEGKPKIECWMQRRYHTEEQAIEGHNRWTKLLREGKYLITYALEKVDYKNPNSKYRFEWRIDFDERHRRILHGAKVHRTWEGTAQAYKEDHLVAMGKQASNRSNSTQTNG